ncbi:hypothetical protein [Pedosphaera parvula]|uniref:Uncharacterized protein n=1 Tax=Pedosphaera parvula (strain Ellin514) TaxID=320771 RepID=B9XC92_PEDPL|nr:hypothetical protein [Pedosphaera parvula]EEF62560.1 hypothetical protein Cflav_PD5195 [Pedosphaera parvula Ellin514]
MSKTYVIHWASRINGRMGKGTTLFEKQEAEQLVKELNHDFPDIHHEMVDNGNESQPVHPPEPVTACQA